jgi:kinesin family protein C2/C3
MFFGTLNYRCRSDNHGSTLLFFSGNIRVYCRVRPSLPGQDEKSTIDYMGGNGEMIISNKLKQGKDGHGRMFKFNKVFNPSATQGMFLSQI